MVYQANLDHLAMMACLDSREIEAILDCLVHKVHQANLAPLEILALVALARRVIQGILARLVYQGNQGSYVVSKGRQRRSAHQVEMERKATRVTMAIEAHTASQAILDDLEHLDFLE